MKIFEVLWELSKCDTEHEVSKCCWKNRANGHAPCGVATNLQFEKKKICKAQWNEVQ